ncbi:MAG: serine hydrolase domain-containing protein, partial [Saprospiraceae bacterium]
LLEDRTGRGIPGMQLSVTTAQGGIWSRAAGLADVYNRVDMQACQLTRVGSTVKIFTAVTCLLLQEEGLLNLDDRIADYLSTDDLQGFEHTDQITIRQLLLHSSGLPNYITSGRFQTASLNDLTKTWTREELLDYAREQAASFEPGADVRYSNTGYILLGDIISAVSGKPFYEVFEERIFLPLGLEFTRFAATDPVPTDLVRGYVDLYSRTELINATQYSGWDYFTADGGLISNAHDLTRFMRALFGGQLLSPASLAEMTDWRSPNEYDPEEFAGDFGLGIFRIPTEFGDAYVHGGDAIGYYAFTAYFPESATALSWAVNGNYGKLYDLAQSKETTEDIFRRVFSD